MKSLLNLWSFLTHIGVPEGLHPSKSRPIIVSNSITVIGIAIMIGYAIFACSFSYYLVVQVNIVFTSLLVACLYFNYLGYHRGARFFGLVVANVMIFAFVLVIGHDFKPHHYYYLLILMPFFIYGREDKVFLVFSVLLTVACFVTQEWYMSRNEPILKIDANSMRAFVYLSEGAFMLLMMSGFYVFYESSLAEESIEKERQQSDKLRANILPMALTSELKTHGQVAAKLYEDVSELFTDFVGFTRVSEKMTPNQLVEELDYLFTQFDDFADAHSLEKLKTIGDAYMCAGGLPLPSNTHSIDCCLMGLNIVEFIREFKSIRRVKKLPHWDVRIGINSGPVMAGVIGKKKFAYDVWGDTVNTASRLESHGQNGQVNISETTYNQIKELFDCRARGYRSVKGKGRMKMYFVTRIKKEFAGDKRGIIPNDLFYEKQSELIPNADL